VQVPVPSPPRAAFRRAHGRPAPTPCSSKRREAPPNAANCPLAHKDRFAAPAAAGPRCSGQPACPSTSQAPIPGERTPGQGPALAQQATRKPQAGAPLTRRPRAGQSGARLTERAAPVCVPGEPGWPICSGTTAPARCEDRRAGRGAHLSRAGFGGLGRPAGTRDDPGREDPRLTGLADGFRPQSCLMCAACAAMPDRIRRIMWRAGDDHR